MFYRQIQIFAILSNQCFQTHIWPAIQFIGGTLLIAMLCCLLLFQTRLPAIGIVFICLIIATMVLVRCLMLDLGSRPILISKKVCRQANQLSGCKWSQKFFKSCPVIALGMGEFHKMDRARVGAFIRFILQRTFFLVMRTKLSKGFGTNMVAHVPSVPNCF